MNAYRTRSVRCDDDPRAHDPNLRCPNRTAIDVVVSGMDRAVAPDPVFRIAAIVCVVAGAAGIAGVPWLIGPLDVPDGVGYRLLLLLQLGCMLCPPVTHLVGGTFMLLRGSIAAATITALVTITGTMFVGFFAIVTVHPLFVAPALTGVVVIALLLLSISRLSQATARR
jgi:hypothetical protein